MRTACERVWSFASLSNCLGRVRVAPATHARGFLTIATGLLVDHPEHLATVAAWLFREWASRHPGSSLHQVADGLQSHLQRDGLPLMVVALDGPECVGCASVRAADLPQRDDLTPWLASVYVPEARRRAGIGALLVRASEAEAARLGITALYLYTPNQQHFYASLGWTPQEQAVHAGATVIIMRRRIGGSASAP